MTDGAQSPDGFSHWLSWLIHVDPLFKGIYRYNGVLYGCMAPLEQIQEKGWDEEAVQQRLEECLGALWYIVMQSMRGWHIDTAEESQSCLPVMSSQDKPSETSGSNTSREMSSTSSWQHPSCITSMPHPSLWFPGSSVHPVGIAWDSCQSVTICHDLSWLRFAHWSTGQWKNDLQIWSERVRKLWVPWFSLSRTCNSRREWHCWFR